MEDLQIGINIQDLFGSPDEGKNLRIFANLFVSCKFSKPILRKKFAILLSDKKDSSFWEFIEKGSDF